MYLYKNEKAMKITYPDYPELHRNIFQANVHPAENSFRI